MRRLAFLAALVGIFLANFGGSGVGTRQHIFSMTFYRTSGTAIDTVADATNNRILSYSTQHADTTGQSVAWTYAKSDSFGFWYLTNATWDLVDVYYDSVGTVTKIHDDLLIVGRVLGDSVITDSLVFDGDVIPGSAIRDNAVDSDQLVIDAVTQAKIADAAIDSVRLATQEVYPAHINTANTTWNFDSVLVASDSLHTDMLAADTIRVTGVDWATSGPLAAASAWTGTTTMPGTPTVLWKTYHAGAEIGDLVWWTWDVLPPSYNQMGEYYGYSIGVNCEIPDTLTWRRNHSTTKTFGDATINYWIVGRP